MPAPRQSHAVSARQARPDGYLLRDDQGRHWLPRGINLVYKGRRLESGSYDFYPLNWPDDVMAQFARHGVDLVRQGIIWAALEPKPGLYDEAYFTFIRRQLDKAAEAGISVILDMHQDLYAQRFADGAPDWAVLTDQPFMATDLWSDAYLFSPAVQQSWDAFWDNAAVPATGLGLQDHFAALWQEIARRFAGHPALFAYDILNEPAPGTPIVAMFQDLLGAFASVLRPTEAQALGLDSMDEDALMRVFMEPALKLQALSVLEDPARFWQVGEACAPRVQAFEQAVLSPFYNKVAQAIRAVDQDTFLLRAHNYLSNLGIPPAIAPITVNEKPDARQIFTPHGYDLVVDTEAIEIASDSRAHTIFKRHRQTQEQVNLPVIVGEWGAFSDSGNALRHGDSLMRQFEGYLWSSTYWCYEPRFFELPAARLLARPSARAVVGTLTSLSFEQDSGTFTAAWQEPDNPQEGVTSLFWAPTDPVKCTLDDAPCTLTRDDKGIIQIPAKGGRRTLLMVFPR